MVRFRDDSDEEWCGEPIEMPGKSYSPVVCLRRQGHGGDHIAMSRDAARADGVCHGCRMPLVGVILVIHREGCTVIP